MYAKRMERLGTETAFEVLARARELERQGRDIVHLEIGEPDFATPRFIADAAVEALREGYTHYGPSAGLPEVREVFAEYISRTRGIDYGGEHVVITPGAKPIIFFTMLACIEEGDEVIYPDPGFPIYESMVRFLGGRPVPLKLREESGFSVDIDQLSSLLTDRTRFLILNSPANPTGGVLEESALHAIADMVRDRNLWILSDEIYSRILYEGAHHSIAALPGMKEKTIILDGHSKTYAMTGWRLGYGVMPTGLAAHVTRLMTNSNSCTNLFVQRAGMKAIQGPQGEVDDMVREFHRRRDVIVEGLNSIPGISCRTPKGAFYAFPNTSKLPLDSKTLARDLLEQGGVAVLSGTAFGAAGEGFLRFSYATSVDTIQKGLGRISEFLQSRHLVPS
jgi:aspartate aminotransferase